MPDLFIDLILGFGIGLSLGLLGGGGSILTVPALVYIAGQSPQAAITTSLAIVGANSFLGAYFHFRHGALNWNIALFFGGSGMLFSYLSAGLSKNFPPSVLMISFAVLMLAIGILMILRHEKNDENTTKPRGLWPILTIGAGIGLLTGFLGVGGGFLIVPTLVMFVGLPIYQAIGTSLIIITANSAAGLLGHISNVSIDPILTSFFILAGLVGTLSGVRLAYHLPAQRLRFIFACFIIILACVLIFDNLGALVKPGP